MQNKTNPYFKCIVGLRRNKEMTSNTEKRERKRDQEKEGGG